MDNLCKIVAGHCLFWLSKLRGNKFMLFFVFGVKKNFFLHFWPERNIFFALFLITRKIIFFNF